MKRLFYMSPEVTRWQPDERNDDCSRGVRGILGMRLDILQQAFTDRTNVEVELQLRSPGI